MTDDYLDVLKAELADMQQQYATLVSVAGPQVAESSTLADDIRDMQEQIAWRAEADGA
jgi:hypothetical protein